VAFSNGMHVLLFEIDSEILSNVATNNSPMNEFGHLVSQCRSLLINRNDFAISYVRRQANKIAHSIARTSLSHPKPHVFRHV